MNKKDFINPTIEIININSEDIIKTSTVKYDNIPSYGGEPE